MLCATPCPDDQTWQRFVSGCLNDDEAAPLEQHLSGCSRCVVHLSGLAEGDPLLDDLRGWGQAGAQIAEPPTVSALIAQLQRGAATGSWHAAAEPSTPAPQNT